MSALCRILLVEETADEWRAALSSLSESGLMNQTTVVNGHGEALDYLYARGAFRRRPSGLPAVVVMGPSLQWSATLALLNHIRGAASLRRVPIVVIAAGANPETIQSAYECGANSVVLRHPDPAIHGQQYAILGLFWGWANEPPGGCLPQPKSERRVA